MRKNSQTRLTIAKQNTIVMRRAKRRRCYNESIAIDFSNEDQLPIQI